MLKLFFPNTPPSVRRRKVRTFCFLVIAAVIVCAAVAVGIWYSNNRPIH